MAIKKRNMANIYGLKEDFGINSWRGLSSYLARSLKVGPCPKLEECYYEHRYRRCKKVIKRSDVEHALEARFMVDSSIAEKLIDTLISKALVHTHRCTGGIRMLSFEE